ncbi:MAG: peptidylprolyl isomerase [Comamonas sp.]
MKKQLLSALVATAALGMSTAVLAQNLAVVNGKPVPASLLSTIKQQFEQNGRPVPPEQEAQLKDALIEREIYAQEARKQGLDATESFKNQVELNRQGLLAQELFAKYEKSHPVTDEAAKAEYNKLVAANSGKEYHAAHILVESEDKAKALIAQIKKGGKFADLAKKESKDPGSGQRGGDLDWANASSYVPEFSEAMTKLKKGEMTSQPVKTQFGYHIIRVDDIREAQAPKFEDVKPQVVQKLRQESLQKYQQELREKAKVE